MIGGNLSQGRFLRMIACSSECFYCKNNHSSRCEKSRLFGTPLLDGAQAEYVCLLPLSFDGYFELMQRQGSCATGRLDIGQSAAGYRRQSASSNGRHLSYRYGLPKDSARHRLLTHPGYFAAHNAFKELSQEQISNFTVVLIGCGPVGLCALINAQEYKPKHLLAVDSVPSRLELAKSLGAEPWNFQEDREGLEKRVKELTDGRGADAVMEVVGLSPAIKMGFELLRPWGILSSVGLHNAEVRVHHIWKNFFLANRL